MPLPTKEQILAEVISFLQHEDRAIQEQVQVIQSIVQRVETQGEEEIDANIHRLMRTPPSLEAIAYQVSIFLASQYPRNDKTENGLSIDPISFEPIIEEDLFVGLDRWHFNVLQLVQWCDIKKIYENPMTKSPYLVQEVTWIKTRLAHKFEQTLLNLHSEDEALINNALQYLLKHPNAIEIPPKLQDLLGHPNEMIVKLAEELIVNNTNSITLPQYIPVLARVLMRCEVESKVFSDAMTALEYIASGRSTILRFYFNGGFSVLLSLLMLPHEFVLQQAITMVETLYEAEDQRFGEILCYDKKDELLAACTESITRGLRSLESNTIGSETIKTTLHCLSKTVDLLLTLTNKKYLDCYSFQEETWFLLRHLLPHADFSKENNSDIVQCAAKIASLCFSSSSHYIYVEDHLDEMSKLLTMLLVPELRMSHPNIIQDGAIILIYLLREVADLNQEFLKIELPRIQIFIESLLPSIAFEDAEASRQADKIRTDFQYYCRSVDLNPFGQMLGKGTKLFSNDNATLAQLFDSSQRLNQVFYASFFKPCPELDFSHFPQVRSP